MPTWRVAPESVVHVAKSRFVPLELDNYPGSNHSHVFRCAFVNFKDRESAELAAAAWANGLEMDGQNIGVKWGRSKAAARAKSVEA